MRPATAKLLAGYLLALAFVLMIIHPTAVYQGAVRGLALWWEVVFPSLLPFFITTELLLALGVVHFLGSLLQPLTSRLFRLPGPAAFALAVGFTSGYPMGALTAARLKDQGMLTASEAARLAAFTNNSSPIFILVAVSVGIYHLPQLGPFLALIHYGSNLLVGLTLCAFTPRPAGDSRSYLPSAQLSVSTGQLLGEAVRLAVQNLLSIAGFIAFFGVLWELARLELSRWTNSPLALGVGAGLLEVSLGIQGVAETDLPLFLKVWLTELWLSWEGLSVIVQVWSFLSRAGVPLIPFLAGRLLQLLYASLLTWLVWPFWAPSWCQVTSNQEFPLPGGATVWLLAVALCLVSCALLALAALLSWLCTRIRR
ncbi:nucleoside recognition domain-containing protein [Desulfothermobacter acidiphilus]|uniref:nucleoside recognition domain-containing protein n=1 Tax=Desulfothermobacter acidiphilus TaxID=1938353 RepID=UPI003F887D14